jgi:formyl-CoA transferase
LIGQKGGAPYTPGIPIGDLATGLLGSWAIMVALYHRDAKGGVGQHIDLGLYESIFRLLEFDPIQYDQVDDPVDRIHTREGNQMSYVAPSDMFRTRDGAWFTLTASQQTIFEDLCQAMGRDDLLRDPRFATNPARVANREEINRIVGEWIAQHTREEVERVIADKGLPGSHVNTMEDVFRNAHYREREMLVRVADPELGDAVVQNAIPRFSKTPGSVRHLGPRLGQHNDEIYRELLGYSDEKIGQLKTAGVI